MEKKKIFIPLNNNVLLEKAEVGEKIEQGGLIIGSVTEKNTIPEATVIEKDKKISEIAKGDKIVFIPHNTYDFFYNGKKHLITNFSNIIGKYKTWE